MVTVATKNYEMFSDTAIALANSDGTGFEIPALFEPFRYTGGVSGKHLVWSPHGRLLAFDGADTVDACGMPDTDCTTHNYGMFVLDYAEGRVIGYVESTLTNPSWSPDGQKLVLSVDAKQSNGGKSGNGDLYILDVNNGQKTRVTADKTSDSYPSWSPDGRQLAFVSDRDGNDEIFLMDLDGKGVVNLSQNPAMDDLPVWSPSGSHIAFTSSRGGLWKPYIMNADGTNQTLVDGDYLDVTGQPSWLPSPP